MLIHREKRLAFICHPRTASHATAQALAGIGFERVGGHHDVVEEHLRPWAVSVACAVRNPLDVLASWWWHSELGTERGLGFAEWLTTRLPFYEGGMFFGLPHADEVLEYERLESQLNDWLGRHGLPNAGLEKVNTTSPPREKWWRLAGSNEVAVRLYEPAKEPCHVVSD